MELLLAGLAIVVSLLLAAWQERPRTAAQRVPVQRVPVQRIQGQPAQATRTPEPNASRYPAPKS